MDEITVEHITTVAGLAALEPEWQKLLEARPRWLPFETPQWHTTWWDHLPESKPWVRDSLHSFALRSRSGELLGVAPMMVTQRPGLGPLGFKALDFIGPDPNLTELRQIICRPDREAEVFAALRRHLHETSGAWHWIHWRGIKEGSEADRTLSGLPTVEKLFELENYVIPLPASWEELKSSRPRNLKESLRKCYNSLKRDGHAFTFEVATSRTEVEQALERFFALHRSRSQVSDTITHRDVFSASTSRDFVTAVSGRLAERGITRVFELKIAGQVVASRVGYVLGDSLYLYYSGYDPKWGDYSVMTTTVAEAMKYAISQGLKQANLSFGTDVSKTRWAPERSVYKELIELAPALPYRYAYPAYQRLRKAMEDERIKRFAGRILARSRAP